MAVVAEVKMMVVVEEVLGWLGMLVGEGVALGTETGNTRTGEEGS
jgi:hypothetical protein